MIYDNFLNEKKKNSTVTIYQIKSTEIMKFYFWGRGRKLEYPGREPEYSE